MISLSNSCRKVIPLVKQPSLMALKRRRDKVAAKLDVLDKLAAEAESRRAEELRNRQYAAEAERLAGRLALHPSSGDVFAEFYEGMASQARQPESNAWNVLAARFGFKPPIFPGLKKIPEPKTRKEPGVATRTCEPSDVCKKDVEGVADIEDGERL